MTYKTEDKTLAAALELIETFELNAIDGDICAIVTKESKTDRLIAEICDDDGSPYQAFFPASYLDDDSACLELLDARNARVMLTRATDTASYHVTSLADFRMDFQIVSIER